MKRVDAKRIYDDVVSTLRSKNLPIKLPGLLHKDGRFKVGGLTLVFFASKIGEIGNKSDLNRFLRTMRCDSTDPQPRHLGMQNGLNFLVKGCFHPKARRVLATGEFSLLDLGSTHPSFAMMHRMSTMDGGTFSKLKSTYGSRCACCGSKEGERHLKNRHAVTALEKGHCDPRKPLTGANCIPMCTLCNKVYKDYAVFNRRGFVVQWLRGGVRPASRKDPEGPPPQRKKKGVRQSGVRVSPQKKQIAIVGFSRRTMTTRSMTATMPPQRKAAATLRCTRSMTAATIKKISD